MYYTLGQAAKATGKTKPTIAHAIKKGRISASRDDMGQYQIDAAELHRVYPPLPSENPQQSDDIKPPSYPVELAKLEGTIEALKATIRGLEAETAAKDNHIRTLMALLPPPAPPAMEPAPQLKPPASVWAWFWPWVRTG